MKENKINTIATGSVIYAINQYKKEVERKLTNENNSIEDKKVAVEFPEHIGTRINIVV